MLKIKHAVLIGLMMILVVVVFAKDAKACVTGPWHSPHKTQHLTNEVWISGLTAAVTKNAYAGVGMGVLAGATREHYKMAHGGNCEWASIVYDLVGIAIGVGIVQHWYIAPMHNGVQVGYSKQF